MAEIIYEGLSLLFGSGMSDSILKWTSKILKAISGISASSGSINHSLIYDITASDFFRFFSIIACSLLTLYFFVDMCSTASKDMLTLEKLVLSFIKLIIAMSILLYLPELVLKFTEIGAKLYYYAADNMTLNTVGGKEIEFFGLDHWPEWTETVEGDQTMQELFEDGFGNSISKFVKGIKYFIIMLLPLMLCMIAKIAGYFIITSTALMLVVRCIYAPIGVVQCFDEGQRSAGIRYLKKFAAEALTFAMIAAILYAASYVTQGILADALSGFEQGGKIVINSIDDIKKIISWSTIPEIILPQLAAVGGMMGAGKLANDILGV